MPARRRQKLEEYPEPRTPSSPILIKCKNTLNCATVHRRTSSGAVELRIATMSPCFRASTHSPPPQKLDLRQAEPRGRRFPGLVSEFILRPPPTTTNDADRSQGAYPGGLVPRLAILTAFSCG